MIRVGINGFGRIGRIAFREMIVSKDFDVVMINSPSTAEEMAYLLKYDSVYRSFHADKITFDEDNLIINGVKKIKITTHRDPLEIPWGENNVDLVIDSSGVFTTKEDLEKHIKSGTKKVILSAPAKGEGVKSIVYGVNDNILTKEDKIVSASSCTTNALVPILKLLNDTYKIKIGYMSTVHAFTNDQSTLDGAHRKGIYSRRGRTATQNIIPTTSGAAKEAGNIIPELKGKISGKSLRVPIVNGSVIDLTLQLETNVTVGEINDLFLKNKNEVLNVTSDPIVSSDVIGIKNATTIDLLSTESIDANNTQLLKVLAWYDNELGYTNQLLRLAKKMFEENETH